MQKKKLLLFVTILLYAYAALAFYSGYSLLNAPKITMLLYFFTAMLTLFGSISLTLSIKRA